MILPLVESCCDGAGADCASAAEAGAQQDLIHHRHFCKIGETACLTLLTQRDSRELLSKVTRDSSDAAGNKDIDKDCNSNGTPPNPPLDTSANGSEHPRVLIALKDDEQAEASETTCATQKVHRKQHNKCRCKQKHSPVTAAEKSNSPRADRTISVLTTVARCWFTAPT